MIRPNERWSGTLGLADGYRNSLMPTALRARPIDGREAREMGRHVFFRDRGGFIAAVPSRERSITERTRSGSALSKRISTAGQPS